MKKINIDELKSYLISYVKVYLDLKTYKYVSPQLTVNKINFNDTSRYLLIPNINTDEYADMKMEFIKSINDGELNQRFSNISRKDLHREFHDLLVELGYPFNDLQDKWWEFEEIKLKSFAIDWCEKNNIEYYTD